MKDCAPPSRETARMPSEERPVVYSVSQSLRDIAGAIERIRAWTAEVGGLDQAIASELVQSAIERQLLIVSEAAIRIEQAEPGYGVRAAPEIDWRGVRGMGNAIQHRHQAMDHRVFHHVVGVELGPLEAACLRLLATS